MSAETNNCREGNQFCNYRLSEDIQQALVLLGYKEPTQIQQEVIPVMLEGSNVVAKAPTGSGKTAAFAIPICEGIVWEENLPQALILEPTRELTIQVKEEVFCIGRKKRLKVPAVVGGLPIDKQILSLRQKSHIVVGTPGRVMDLIRRDSLKLEKIDSLVIDEADLMLDMGFMEEMREILSRLPAGCRISLFSATLKPEIQQLVSDFIRNPQVVIQQAQPEQVAAIAQVLYETDADSKFEDFKRILINENPECCIIFCATREMVNTLFQKMRRNRMFCGMLHGEMEQRERLKTVDAFRRGGFRFLIATDVAARGVDFEQITHVINYDFPMGRETYVHRIGRTGRNGKKGRAISLVCENEKRMLKEVEEYTGQELPLLTCPRTEEIQERAFWKSQRAKTEARPSRAAALNRDITRITIGGGRKSKLRSGDIVGAVCSIPGVAADDIGIIDIRDSLTYVEMLNKKGPLVLEHLPNKTIKGKIRKIKESRYHD